MFSNSTEWDISSGIIVIFISTLWDVHRRVEISIVSSSRGLVVLVPCDPRGSFRVMGGLLWMAFLRSEGISHHRYRKNAKYGYNNPPVLFYHGDISEEFHLSQTYQEGLLKLQAKEYEKARQLLESVLKDPLIANAQVDGSASDGHLLQLRFLALKNLANVFLQQGSLHYENALHCYLQAVEIDTKDSVVWNQLGTLSCSMGLLSISRWAFEQGLLCSPNNWNCMEKLLEVLIAIGDEVACLSVTELILRHWPSHSRALHVKQTIEDSEPVPFAPRGIDKLEPKHVRLKFLDKRKAADENLDEGIACKKLNHNLELHLAEDSWKMLLGGRKEKTLNPITAATLPCDTASETVGLVKEKDTNVLEEQPRERRSTRLERLRNRKPGKEDLDFTNDKDQAKVVIQYLEPYISGELALDHPNYMNCDLGDGNSSIYIGSQCDDGTSVVGHKEKALEQFSISLSLLTNSKKPEGSQSLVHLPHCKVVKEITIDRVLHQINFLKVDFLMEKTLGEMIEKELYMDCMTLLAPLLFSTKDVHLDMLSFLAPDKEGEEITSIELSALDILLKACEKAMPLDFEVYLNCHRRKLQILMAIAGMDDGLACKSFHMKLGLKGLYASDVELKESSCKRWNSLVSKEVKAISQCVSQIKNLIDPHADTDSNIVPASTVKDIQSLLLSVMCNIAGIFLSKKASGLEIADQIERHCFVEAAIAFCKLQHLNLTVPVKTQPPIDILAENAIDKFLDDPDLCEDQLSEEAGSDGFLESITKAILPNLGSFKQHKMSLVESSEPYLEVYSNLYYFLALSEEMSATDKWPGFVLTKEGEEFVQHNANLFKYDLLYNPLRFESWERLANIYDEEVELLLNDGSKHINVSGWRKNAMFSKRVDTSRKRSRRCLLMSLALAKTSSQQCEIHELLALVYYDSLQNVVPFYDQRSVIPVKDAAWMTYCENSMRHFKKAFAHKQDWSDAYYIGKLCEKLGFSSDISLSYYDKSINLNPSAVDSVYRMHASRLKLLFTCGKQNLEALKVLSVYSFSQSNKDAVLNVLNRMDAENARTDRSKQEDAGEIRHEDLLTLEVWRILYSDCLSALEACVEGDLKHFHKARYMLAQSLYKRGDTGDLEKAKDELSFCFKSSRSSFTINMWEIDSTVKKEEETGDICTLERAYVSLRADKRFSLCIEDLVPVALGRYVKALVSSMGQAEKVGGAASSSEQILEKLFSLFIEQGNLWPEICSLSETKGPETSESSLYGYLHEHITLLERNGKLEILEGINEKIRKRFKNPKLSNSNCAKVCRHASVAWCRSLIISLGQITPSLPTPSTETHVLCQSDGSLDSQLLCVDLQIDELWNSAFENPTQLKALEIKWRPILSKMKHVMIKKVSDENLEAANALLKSSYNFHRESSCVMPPSGVNLFLVPSWLARDNQFQPSMNGIEILDLSVPRKLILWAYTLLHGRYANISVVVKYCEENAKSKMKKGAGTTSAVSNASIPNVVTTQTGGQRDGACYGGGNDAEATLTPAASTSVAEGNATPSSNPSSCSMDSQKVLFAAQQHSNYTGERSNAMAQEADPNKG
uniref:Uncharacterized protein n=1 Tax=Cannabis sativa TaxID=3483 RepID=A0A803PHX4_CANSA